MPTDRMKRGLAAAVLLASLAALGGCSSISELGVAADAPARAKDPSGYLPVHDIPPDRSEQMIKPSDQAKIEQELIAARDRQAAAATATAAQSGTTTAQSTK
jgi:hypothetical protein